MKRIFLCLLFILSSFFSYATHIIGAEISYTQIPGSDSLYIVTYKYYRDCGLIGTPSYPEPPTITLCISNSCSTAAFTAFLPKIVGQIPTTPVSNNGSEIYNPCSGQTTCTNINATVHGYRQWWYQDTISLPYACNSWKIEVVSCCRLDLSYNLGPAPPAVYNFYLEAKIDNSVYNYNNSPVFQYDSSFDKLPIPQVQVNIPYIHTGGAIDADGDSLVFETIKPRDKSGCTTALPNAILINTYNISDSAGNPFSTNNSYFLDKHTGHYTFVPTMIGYADLAHKVSEYRNGILIGSVMRDINIVTEPSVSGSYSFDSVHVCPGGSYTFPNMITLNNLQSDTFMYNYFTNSSGCDSIILSLVDVVHFVDTMIQNGNVLTSMEIDSTTTFQWITCNPFSILVGDTTNTLIAMQSGYYAVIMSKYGCSDTSNCYNINIPTSTSDIAMHDFFLSPNPTHRQLQISLTNPLIRNEVLDIYNLLGQKVEEVLLNKNNMHFMIDVEKLPNAIYVVKIGNTMKRFVKN